MNADKIRTAHKIFEQYKGCHAGKDVVVIAAGPSLENYEQQENSIHIGVNRTFLRENLRLDYLFMQDYTAVKAYIDKAVAYRPDTCLKLYGIHSQAELLISDDIATNANAMRYYAGKEETPFSTDIASAPMPEYCSVVFPALAFAAYTTPERIFLAGCDCSDLGYFDKTASVVTDKVELSNCVMKMRHGWESFKSFMQRHYPETEVISINPVGLKGLFKDQYTRED